MHFSAFWFLPHIPIWEEIFSGRSEGIRKILEIGSWEGMSARFLSFRFSKSSVVAVDTWEGSEENDNVPIDLLQRFQKNTADLGDRVITFRGTSSDFFRQHSGEHFDLIYIDGSHEARDVLRDALDAWAVLKPGGYLVFDDYLWFYYGTRWRNPGWAINAFLGIFRTEMEVLHAGYQLFIRKNPELATAS